MRPTPDLRIATEIPRREEAKTHKDARQTHDRVRAAATGTGV